VSTGKENLKAEIGRSRNRCCNPAPGEGNSINCSNRGNSRLITALTTGRGRKKKGMEIAARKGFTDLWDPYLSWNCLIK